MKRYFVCLNIQQKKNKSFIHTFLGPYLQFHPFPQISNARLTTFKLPGSFCLHNTKKLSLLMPQDLLKKSSLVAWRDPNSAFPKLFNISQSKLLFLTLLMFSISLKYYRNEKYVIFREVLLRYRREVIIEK